MKRRKPLFLIFLKDRLAIFVCAIVMLATFALMLWLYGLALEGALYGLCLCAVQGAAVMTADYIRFKKRISALIELNNSLDAKAGGAVGFGEQFEAPIPDTDLLPAPSNAAEWQYNALVTRLSTEIVQLSGQAHRAEADRREYYATWVHQIKTPITVMRLLLSNGETAYDDETLRKLNSELFKIEQYVEMALSYTRLSSGGSDYMFKRHDIDAITRAAIRKYAQLFISKKLKVDYTPIEFSAVTDEKWLQFCIEQILSNAVKYTGGALPFSAEDSCRGCISVRGEAILQGSGGNAAYALVISDNGIGIAAEDIPRVFDMGYTGYNGRADKKSTGIGLYLCKQALTRIGHGISIESAVGVGTTVRIEFFNMEAVE